MRHLSLPEVIELHRLVISAAGGYHGVRDLSALESALAQPRMSFAGEDLYPLADLRRPEDPLAKALKQSWWPRIAVRWVCAGVFTTTGQQCTNRVDRNAWDELLGEGS